MPATILKNVNINERQTISGETYFIIKDNETEQVYFCFQDRLKTGWTELVNNKESIRELEIEFEENERGNKVIGLEIWKDRQEVMIKKVIRPYNEKQSQYQFKSNFFSN